MCEVMRLRNTQLQSKFAKCHIAQHDIVFHKLSKKITVLRLKPILTNNLVKLVMVCDR